VEPDALPMVGVGDFPSGYFFQPGLRGVFSRSWQGGQRGEFQLQKP